MECFMKISSDGKVLIAKAIGALDEAAYLMMRSKIVDSIKNCTAKNILLDIRHAIVAASVVEIYHIVASSVKMFPMGFKYAIVYSDKTISEENAKFGETVARNRGGQLFVFKDISEAKEWLAIPEVEIE
jgi:hypothetical protein